MVPFLEGNVFQSDKNPPLSKLYSLRLSHWASGVALVLLFKVSTYVQVCYTVLSLRPGPKEPQFPSQQHEDFQQGTTYGSSSLLLFTAATKFISSQNSPRSNPTLVLHVKTVVSISKFHLVRKIKDPLFVGNSSVRVMIAM